VADASAPEVEDQVSAVHEVLAEIDAGDIPEVLALNKTDLVSEVELARARRRFPDAVTVSARTGEGLEELLVRIEETLPSPPIEVDLLVPYDRQDVVARLYREAEVDAAESGQDGTAVRARVREDQLEWVAPFTVRRVSRRARLG
jgi:GTPase